MRPGPDPSRVQNLGTDACLAAFRSQSGVVNVYSLDSCLHSAQPKPLKSLMNLLTLASSLTFNPTSDILAIASRAEDEAVRLVRRQRSDAVRPPRF